MMEAGVSFSYDTVLQGFSKVLFLKFRNYTLSWSAELSKLINYVWGHWCKNIWKLHNWNWSSFHLTQSKAEHPNFADLGLRFPMPLRQLAKLSAACIICDSLSNRHLSTWCELECLHLQQRAKDVQKLKCFIFCEILIFRKKKSWWYHS